MGCFGYIFQKGFWGDRGFIMHLKILNCKIFKNKLFDLEGENRG
jgi:hypothetical protein